MSEHPQESSPLREDTPAAKAWWLSGWQFLFRVAKYLSLFLLVLVSCLFILLQFTFFQTWLAGYGTQYLSEKTGFRVQIESVYLNIFESQLTLEKLHVHDLQNRTMIFAECVFADFEYTKILENGDVNFQEVTLHETSASLTVDKESELLNINQWITSLNELFAKKDKKTTSAYTLVAFKKVKINNSFFGYTDERKPIATGERIDFAHFGIDALAGDINNLRIVADTVEANINSLRGLEYKTQLPIHHLGTFFRLTDQSIDFRNLLCKVGESTLKDALYMHFKQKSDLSEFVEKVTLVAYLDSTVIHTKDLALFAPQVEVFKDTWTASGLFRGRINDFSVTDLDLAWGRGSRIKGAANLDGLPNIGQTFMRFDVKEGTLVPSELEMYLNQPTVSEVMNRFGQTRFRAEFVGFINDFVANGEFLTALGNFNANINLKIRPNTQNSYYKGELTTQALDLGRMLAVPNFGAVTMQGKVEGTGFNPEYAQLTMDAQLKSFDFKGYSYQNITVDGKLSRKHFEGKLDAKDENFDLSLNGELDYNAQSEDPNTPPGRFDLNAEVRKLNLQALNLVNQHLLLSGNLSMDTYGLSLDSLTGDARLEDLYLEYKEDSLYMKSLDLLTFKTSEGNRFFTLNSDFFGFNAEGKFIFSQVFENLNVLVQEYILIFKNDQEAIAQYYENKKREGATDYNFDFSLDLKNINPIIQLFGDAENLHLSPYTRFTGSFSQNEITRFELYTDSPIDTFSYNGANFLDSKLNLTTIKSVYAPSLLAQLDIASKKQNLAGVNTQNLLASATWGGSLIQFLVKAEQTNSTNNADFAGNIEFQDNQTLIAFEKANLKFLEENWSVSADNQVKIQPNVITFKDIVLSNNLSTNSSLRIGGILSDTLSDETLKIKIQDVELYPFADVFGRDIKGVLNAEINLLDVYRNFQMQSNTNLENLLIDKILIGDLDGKLDWKGEDKKLEVDAKITRRGKYIFDLLGTYNPKDPANALDFKADFDRTNLKILEPFVSFLFSDLRGTATGVLDIKGTLDEPIINGKLKIPNGKMRVNYPNTVYDLAGDVIFTPNQIVAPSFNVYDEQGNRARLGVEVFLDNFKQPSLDIEVRFFNFQLLNTTAEDNSLFYGTAYGTGSMRIGGVLDRLSMSVNARSERGTKISLPLDGYEEVAQKEFIQFVQPGQSLLDSIPIQKVDLGGLTLDFNLEIDQNAEFEIIFDKKAGDIIRGSGKGLIDMNIGTEGDIALFGYYVIEKGQYNFTFANLVNKAFEIRPGSRVTFNGDMFDTQLDVYAIYKRNIPLNALVDLENVPDPENGEYRRPYEVAAILDLKGKLLTPEIRLDLDLSEAKRTPNINLQTAVYQLDTQIQNDEQERSRQVFSLLILNRLSPPNSFRGGGVAGTAGSSLSEMLSNQFSNWISQVDENLELRFDVDASNLNNFQLRVSYSLLDGRLRITRDGGFINNQNQADFASVIGDWTVEYLLSPGGKYRIKMYHRINQNLVNTLNTGVSTAGVSFVHTASFNSFGELFSSKNKKKRKKEKATSEYFKRTDDLATPMMVEEDELPKIEKKSIVSLSSIDKMPLQKRNASITENRSELDKILENSPIIINKEEGILRKLPVNPVKPRGYCPLEHRYSLPTPKTSTPFKP